MLNYSVQFVVKHQLKRQNHGTKYMQAIPIYDIMTLIQIWLDSGK